jgi:hypothetical protein
LAEGLFAVAAAEPRIADGSVTKADDVVALARRTRTHHTLILQQLMRGDFRRAVIRKSPYRLLYNRSHKRPQDDAPSVAHNIAT